jgi:hypothetical protein
MSIHDSETVEHIRPAFAAGKYFVHLAVDLAYEFGADSHNGLVHAGKPKPLTS